MGTIEDDALFVAISAGDLVRVRSTLDAGANAKAERAYDTNLDREAYEGTESAVLVATRGGHEPIVRLILERGADPNAADSLTGRTALVEASANGRLNVVETLLAHGADPSARDALAAQNCLTAAIAGEHADVARALVKAGARAEPASLEQACLRGRLDLAQLCVDAGCDVQTTNALKTTAMAGQVEALQWLVQNGADVTNQGPEALLDAANAGKADAVRYLITLGVSLESRTDYGWTPLHLAAYNGNASTVQVLIAAGADIRADDGTGKTPLDWAREQDKRENVAELEKALGTLGA